MDEARRIWREKSDEDLIEAAAELDQFTEQGQEIIRAELKRRHLEDPVAQAGAAGDAEPGPECLRCHVPLRLIDANDRTMNGRWTVLPGGGPFDPSVPIDTYVCPKCGHVDLFMDVRETDRE